MNAHAEASAPTILDGALDAAGRGWHVFPVPPGKKESHKSAKFSGGRKWGATVDSAEIRLDWQTWPRANLGIATGPKSGFFVVECDTAEGHDVDGIGNMVGLLDRHGPLPDTIEALSPSGSWHVYFRWPAQGGIANSASKIAPGIDVRGDGGMVLAPPSVKPGATQPYRWKNPPGLFELAACPEWLLALCRKPEQVVRAMPSRSIAGVGGWASKAMAEELSALFAAPAGQRNDALNRATFSLAQIVGAGLLDAADTRARLAGAAASIGLSGDEAERTIESAFAAGLQEPRGPKERRSRMRMVDVDIISRGAGAEYGDLPEDNSPPRRRSPRNSDAVTEDIGAIVFAERWGGTMLFCHDQGRWFVWNGAYWEPERTGLAFDRARDIARELAEEEASPKAKAAICKTGFASGVERFARHDRVFAVTAETWDRDALLLGTPGGTVDLKTGVLRPADINDRITRATACPPAERADCPIWLGFLDQATNGDAALIRFLQQWCGYSLTGDTREHALIFVHGGGGNGKGVFLNTVASIARDYAVTAAMDTFTASQSDRHPTDLAMLRGARMVSASETEEGRAWAEARIKALTGGDPISARYMRQDFFTFLPAFKLTIVGNHKPVLRNVDDAARRRIAIVPFTHKPPQPDRTLTDRLKAEWPAILRWMIDGALDWQRYGLIRPASVLAETASYFNDQDLFSQWLDDDCDAEPGNTYKSETSAKLFESWSTYQQRAGERPVSRKSFGDMMMRKGLEVHRSHGGVRQFRGVCLRHREDNRYSEGDG